MTKFALTEFSVSLAFELEAFNIKVTNLAPGMFRTNFYDKSTWRTTPNRRIKDYDSCRWQDEFIKNNIPKGDPHKLAQVIFKMAYIKNPPLHLPIGADVIAVFEEYAKTLKSESEIWCNSASALDESLNL